MRSRLRPGSGTVEGCGARTPRPGDPRVDGGGGRRVDVDRVADVRRVAAGEHDDGRNAAQAAEHELVALLKAGLGQCQAAEAVAFPRVGPGEEERDVGPFCECDVHQGDGTAQIFADDRATFTVSLHGARNYPFERIPSDLDVDLPSGTGDAEYLQALERALDAVPAFDAAFYLAGADPWEGDRLGRLALTKAGLRARDELALDRLLSIGAPVCVVLAGGYAEDPRDTVDINAATVAAVAARASV